MSVYKFEDRIISGGVFPYGVKNAERVDLYYDSVSLLVTFDDNNWITDLSPRPKTLTISNYVVQDEGCASFGGVNTYLTTATHDDFKFRTGDYTIECWVYMPLHRGTGDWTKDSAIFGPSVAGGNGVAVFIDHSGNLFGQWDNATGGSFAMSIPTKQWAHLTWVRQGGYAYGFLNGIKSTYSFLYNKDQNSTSSFRIGGYCFSNSSRYFLGKLRDLRVTKGVARYSQDFIPISPGHMAQTVPIG